MPKALLSAYSQPATPQQEAEFNRWYDEVHIPQILQRVPGMLAATRYRLSATQISSPEDCPERRYLTIYEVDTSDLAAFADQFVKALGDGTLDTSDAIDLSGLAPIVHVYDPA